MQIRQKVTGPYAVPDWLESAIDAEWGRIIDQGIKTGIVKKTPRGLEISGNPEKLFKETT